MTAEKAFKVAPALIMLWSALTDTDGESLETTWEEWFASFDKPSSRYQGDMQHSLWSACYCEPPRRKSENVVALSAVVLDYDEGDVTVESAADLWADYYGAIHTTRSHTSDLPRFRVVLPLARTVTPEEYRVIWTWASKIAAGAGHKIDKKTKDPARPWYRPAQTDAYEARRLGGEPIDPDLILGAQKYEENERRAQEESRDREVPVEEAEKRAAAYVATMPEAISGQGGHQALWAVAQAVVRGFVITGERAVEIIRREYNPRCKPTWTDKELRHKVSDAEHHSRLPWGYLLNAKRAPLRLVPPPDDGWQPPEVPPDMVDDEPAATDTPRVASEWRAQLHTTPQGHVRKTFDNVCVILEHHPRFGENLTYDEMRLTPLLGGRPVSDADVGRVRREIEQNFGFQPSESDVRAAIGVVSDARRFHPVRRYLSSLVWDGVPRIEKVVTDILHADNTALHQAIVRRWFVSAVARAMNPGCKVDSIFVLQGTQGSLKSTFFSVLGGEWFSDTFMNITDKDGLLQLHSAWIYEWAEIESITSVKQAAVVRAFASSKCDTFRAPFGRTVEIHPRSSVIVGSVNPEQFLTDPEGSRRFHVVRIPPGTCINVAALKEQRDALWAEALVLYTNNEQWHLTEIEDADRATTNAEFEVEDAWESLVVQWLQRNKDEITTAAILVDAVKVLPAQINRTTEMRVGAIMRRLGYVSKRKRGDGKSILRVWEKQRV